MSGEKRVKFFWSEKDGMKNSKGRWSAINNPWRFWWTRMNLLSAFVKKKVGVLFSIGRTEKKKYPTKNFGSFCFYFFFGNIDFTLFFSLFFFLSICFECSVRKKKEKKPHGCIHKMVFCFPKIWGNWEIVSKIHHPRSRSVNFATFFQELVSMENFSHSLKLKSQSNQQVFFIGSKQPKIICPYKRAWILKIGNLWINMEILANEKKRKLISQIWHLYSLTMNVSSTKTIYLSNGKFFHR